MKLCNKHIKFIILITLISINTITSNLIDTKKEEPANAKKFLFMYKYPLLKDDPNHKLNIFTFKNVLFSNDEVVFFESLNEGVPVKIFKIKLGYR